MFFLEPKLKCFVTTKSLVLNKAQRLKYNLRMDTQNSDCGKTSEID